jgi:hypothetical protein
MITKLKQVLHYLKLKNGVRAGKRLKHRKWAQAITSLHQNDPTNIFKF